MPNQDFNLNIRSEEVQDILSYVPSWMIRYGNMLILIIIIMLLAISYFVKYPDVVIAEAIVTTTAPPDNVIAKISGKIEDLLVHDNDYVKKNTIMAVIENSAAYKDVLLLKSFVDSVTIGKAVFHFPMESLPVLFLGDVSSDYAMFELNYHAYELNKKLKPFSYKFDINGISIVENMKRLSILEFQKELSQKELELQHSEFNRSNELFEQGVIATMEFEKNQLSFLQAQKEYQNVNSLISQIKESLDISRKNHSSTEIEKIQNESKLLKNTLQSFYQLKKSIYEWESRYTLKSSINGKVSFLSHWNANQNIEAGNTVFSVIPVGNFGYIGKMKAPIQNSGKLKVGQKTNIRLKNYPHMQYGMLTGVIENISLVPDKDGFYHIDVKLATALVTTYNKEIEFKQEMRGTAEIITDELRLIDRFFNQIKHILKH